MNFTETLIGRENTQKTYLSLFKTHVQPACSVEEAAKFTQEDLKQLTKKWIEKELKPNTIKLLIRLAARYIAWAGGEKLSTSELINQVGRLEQQEVPKTLTKEQLTQLIDFCATAVVRDDQSKNFYLAVLLAGHAGLRRGEIFGLEKEDFDLDRNRIHIRRSYNGLTKSGFSRMVPMTGRVIQEVSTLPTGRILPQPFDPNYYLKPCLKRLELPLIKFHDLRHTFATLGLESGVDPRQMQLWLGHRSVKTTLDIYWSSRPDNPIEFLS